MRVVSALRMYEAASASDGKNRSHPARADWSNACPLSLADRGPSRGANLAAPAGLVRVTAGAGEGKLVLQKKERKKPDKS